MQTTSLHWIGRTALLLVAALFGLAAIAALMLVLAPQPTRAQGPIYVDANARGNYDGTSWTDAYTNVQDALADTIGGDQVWVAQGVYYPDEGTGQVSDSPTSTFQLLSGVALYGGFTGTETALEQRDWTAHVTVLSGDIDQNDGTDSNGVVTDTAYITGTNAYHVVTASSVTETAVLDGFTITAGRANGGGQDQERGGGMYAYYSSPTLAHITFMANYADNWGGGVYGNRGDMTMVDVAFVANHAHDYPGGGVANFVSSPVITNAVFMSNTAPSGGGMYNSFTSDPQLAVVTFTANVALVGSGGGIYNVEDSSPSLQHATFISNTATGSGFGVSGGGMYNYGGSPVLVHTTFISNASGMGGGMYSGGGATLVLTDVTFRGNTAEYGGGMFSREATPTLALITFTLNIASYEGGGMYHDTEGSVTLSRTVFYSNTSERDGGGGMYSRDVSLTLDRVAFVGNIATGTWGRGGGMLNYYETNPLLVNVLFSGNYAHYDGGGIHNWMDCSLTLVNVTLSGNTAGNSGGGLNNDGYSGSTAMLTNTILWGNTASTGAELHSPGGGVTVSHSLVGGSGGSGAGWDTDLGTDGGGNVDADPRYVDPDGADGISGTLDDDLRLQIHSPAIDSGDSAALPAGVTTDLDGGPRIVGSAVDMGPYESIQVTRTYLPAALRSY